jgi:hypothetical protein
MMASGAKGGIFWIVPVLLLILIDMDIAHKNAPVDRSKDSNGLIKSDVSGRNGPRAFFLAWVTETVIGAMIFVIFFGSAFYPLYNGVVTTGWDPYSSMLWGFLPFIALAAFVSRVFISAKQGFTPVI